jgi:4-hydroxybenzoate polyprenyltransferase
MVNLPSKIRSNKFILTLVASIKAARPIHWVKNLTLFAPLVFTGTLLVPGYFNRVILAFIIFCLASSATYIFNDILDVKMDRLHPIKRFRPIASGALPVPLALIIYFGLVLISIFFAAKFNSLFLFIILTYLFVQILYSLFLKKLAIIDILLIAAGFLFRIYAGAFVINAHLSVWFLLCVISLALFLASGKRRAELGIIANTEAKTRESLSKYSKPLLDSFVTMFGNAAWMSWALFTFFESPRASVPFWLFLAEISKATTINKLLMITIPLVIFGIMRYESIIFEDRSESPEKVLISDRGLIVSVLLWGLVVLWVFYGGISTNLI